MVGQMWAQMLAHTDGTHAGASSAVWYCESLVQVEVTDVASHVPRRRDSHQSIHVGTIDVDLASAPVDDVGSLLDSLIENAMRRRLRDHSA